MKPKMIALLFACAVGAGVTFAACGKDNPTAPDAEPGDDVDARPMIDAGGPIDADCVMNPTTSADLLNGCTTAQKIDRDPVLPLRLPDGGLPMLPP